MTAVDWARLAVLLLAPPAAGTVTGFLLHWWLELRALRPAYRATRAAIRGDRIPG